MKKELVDLLESSYALTREIDSLTLSTSMQRCKEAVDRLLDHGEEIEVKNPDYWKHMMGWEPQYIMGHESNQTPYCHQYSDECLAGGGRCEGYVPRFDPPINGMQRFSYQDREGNSIVEFACLTSYGQASTENNSQVHREEWDDRIGEYPGVIDTTEPTIDWSNEDE